MQKLIATLFSMLIVFSCCACGIVDETGQSEDMVSRAVFANGSLYLDTGNISTAEGRCGVMDGEITDTVKPNEYPIKNNQSNFGTGYEYQWGSNNALEVFIDEEYIIFERQPDNELGVLLSSDSVHSTGLTLIIRQKGGNAQGELQTGAAYELERMEEEEWELVDAINGEPIAWNDIAYLIPKDGELSMDLDWSNVYGELPAGDYRIKKTIMDLRSPGDYDTTESYAYFHVYQD